jgi:hypothetical protein
MAFTVRDFEDLVRLLEEHPEWRTRMRQIVLTQELLELPELVRQLVESQRRMSEEFEAYRRLTDQRLAELTATVQRLSEEFAAYRLEADKRFEEFRLETNQRFADMAALLQWVVERLERLENWQRGETGRREGERYEQSVQRQALALFAGGQGGNGSDLHVREKVRRWLAPLYKQGMIDEQENPLLSDLLWWKGERVMVTEVSLKVDAQDVRRAVARAHTLRKVGVDAVPAVIGREWATPDTQTLAQQAGVEWMVDGELSPGFLEFRQREEEAISDA